jgi:hypothetical protein
MVQSPVRVGQRLQQIFVQRFGFEAVCFQRGEGVFCGEFPEIQGRGVFAYYKRVGEGLDRRGLVYAKV